MKKLITLLTLVFAVSNANARSIMVDTTMKSAHLDTVILAEDSPLANSYDIDSATIQISENRGMINLYLYQVNPCLEGMMCPRIAISPVIYRAFITGVHSDFCGLITYTAVLDNLADEDELTHIEVMDSSEMTCKILVQPTTVRLNRIYNTEDGVEKYTHHFLGTEYLTSPF